MPRIKIQTREDLLEYVLHSTLNGWIYRHPDWSPDLWTRNTDDIYKYLVHRFCSTLDRNEYYGIMPYLVHRFPEDTICVLFDHRFTEQEFYDDLAYMHDIGLWKAPKKAGR